MAGKGSTSLDAERFRVAAFYLISHGEPGLRGVSLGNFLIKTVAQLKQELPQPRAPRRCSEPGWSTSARTWAGAAAATCGRCTAWPAAERSGRRARRR